MTRNSVSVFDRNSNSYSTKYAQQMKNVKSLSTRFSELHNKVNLNPARVDIEEIIKNKFHRSNSRSEGCLNNNDDYSNMAKNSNKKIEIR